MARRSNSWLVLNGTPPEIKGSSVKSPGIVKTPHLDALNIETREMKRDGCPTLSV